MHAWRRFFRNESGNAAILAALTAPIMVLFLGGGVDYAMSLNARAKLQSAMDAALLSTAVHKSANPGLSMEQLQEYFRRQLQERVERRMKKILQLQQIDFSVSEDNNTLSVRVSATTKTRFLQLVALDRFEIRLQTEVKSARSRTEVALVLDVTRSMSGAKLTELKNAAKNFLEEIARKIPDADPEAFKVAIVPFSQYVNVGMENRDADWIDVPEDGWRDVSYDGWGWWWWWARRYVKWEGCVGSRPYPLNVKDESYSTPVPGVMNYAEYSSYGEWVIRNSCPSTSILPLTSLKEDKEKIIWTIDSLQADGTTYIPAGLIWGWRVLSPTAPFTEGAQDDTTVEQNVRKVIVLMTDGENTVSPYVDDDEEEAYREHTGSDIGLANDLTLEVCNRIKEINPATGRPHAEIITVTFDVSSSTVKNLLAKCSTLGTYDAQSGQLVETFSQITQQLAELHLSR